MAVVEKVVVGVEEVVEGEVLGEEVVEVAVEEVVEVAEVAEVAEVEEVAEEAVAAVVVLHVVVFEEDHFHGVVGTNLDQRRLFPSIKAHVYPETEGTMIQLKTICTKFSIL